MPDTSEKASVLTVPLLPYHEAVVAYLRREEAELWDWFAAAGKHEDQARAVRLDLLKTAYRLERAAVGELYTAAETAAAALGVNAPITFYQMPNAGGMNAGLAYVPGEVHLVLQGPVLATLKPAELQALLGHELAHFLFCECRERQFHTAADILAAMTNDRCAEPAHLETARMFQLYTEVYCDRASLQVCGDLAAAVATQVKIATGLTEVSAESYLRQAAEIFSLDKPTTEGITHPECFIRARALELWHTQGSGADAAVEKMIAGTPELPTLDLLARQRLAALTQRLVTALLAPAWLRSEPILAHARMFFENFTPATAPESLEALAPEVQALGVSVHDYLSYVLLDFAVVDRNLEDVPLAAAIEASRKLGIEAPFLALIPKELGLKKRAIDKLVAKAAEMVAAAAKSARCS